ncbi:MAG: type II toxin-antitoxin system RelE/ParE family toxin [Actinomycetota bacterium]
MKRLVIRTAARADILQQVEYYLDEFAFDAARRFPLAVQTAMGQSQEMPGIGAAKVLNNPRLKGLRSWPVSGFEAHRIYYVETPDAIRVIRILHGMRDLPPILEDE